MDTVVAGIKNELKVYARGVNSIPDDAILPLKVRFFKSCE